MKYNTRWLNFFSIIESREAQKEMAKEVISQDELPSTIQLIGGTDLSHFPFDPESKVFSACVVLSSPSLNLVETATVAQIQTVPYIPGFLGFREVPSLLKAYEKLSIKPDILLVDGHGLSHPRGLGVATHLGLLLGIPTIGVAKSILIGTPAESLSEEAGAMTPLLWKGKERGMVIRTKTRCNPIIVSIGHKVSLSTAVQVVLNCVTKYRLPEPTRLAHFAANQARLAIK